MDQKDCASGLLVGDGGVAETHVQQARSLTGGGWRETRVFWDAVSTSVTGRAASDDTRWVRFILVTRR